VLVESLESIAGILARFSPRRALRRFGGSGCKRHAWQGRRVALSQAGRRVAEGKVVGGRGGRERSCSPRSREYSVSHSGELSLRPGMILAVDCGNSRLKWGAA